MASSPSPDETWELVHEKLLKLELTKANVANAYSCVPYWPFSDAASLLADVPDCLQAIAGLNVLATGPDFPLRSSKDVGIRREYHFLKTDSSFRASACQASNMVMNALMLADTCMTEIFIETGAIPELMKVFDQLKPDSPGAFDLLPASVIKLGQIASSCAIKVDIVINRISEVMGTLIELMEATLFAFEIEGASEEPGIDADVKKGKEMSRGDIAKVSNKVVTAVVKRVEEEGREVRKALEKSGNAAAIAKQIIVAMWRTESAVNEAACPSKQSRLSERYVKKQHVYLQTLKEPLRRSRAKADDDNELLLVTTKKLAMAMSVQNAFNAQEVDHKQIIATCLVGLEGLTGIKEKWMKLPHYIYMIAGMTTVLLSKPMSLRSLTPAYDAANAGHYTNELAKYYCQVSQKHFMPLANKLASLIVMDPEEDADQIEQEKKELKDEVEAMQKRIEKMVMRQKEKSDAKAERIETEMERIFKEYVPDISREIKAVIKTVVQKKFDEKINVISP